MELTTDAISRYPFDYLVMRSIIDNNGDRDATIENLRLKLKSVSEQSFNNTILPLIDRNLKFYNKKCRKE
jgi:hypothetical protein